MLRRLFDRFRKPHPLKSLLFFYVFALALVAFYLRSEGSKLWNAAIYVDTGTKYVFPARGPALLLPTNWLPHDVLWLVLAAVVIGTITICVTYAWTTKKAKKEAAGLQRTAADELQAAAQRSAAAEQHLQSVMEREKAAQAAEQLAEKSRLAAVEREKKAEAHIQRKDVEITKMSQALTRLKQQNKDLRQEVRELRQRLNGQ